MSVIERTQPTIRTAGAIAGITALIGVVANLILLAVGELAGAELVATSGGVATKIGVVQVVFGSIVPLVAGFVALAVATRWGARAWVALAWVGLVLAVLTAPMALTAQASAGTAVVLGAMHLTVGAAWFFLIRKSLQDNA
jgi:hypothetical protein